MSDFSEMIVESVSNKLIDEIFKNFKGIQNFIVDTYKINTSQKKYWNQIFDLQFVRTINDFGDDKKLFDFFVTPHIDIKQQNRITVNDLSCFNSHRHILIQGIVGQGKSVLMKYLAIKETFVKDKITLFFELRNLREINTVDELLKKIFSDWLDIENSYVIRKALESGKITLFFDGFDELDKTKMLKALDFFDYLNRKFPELTLVVSSRPETIIENSTIFSIYNLSKLNLIDQIEIIHKLNLNDGKKKAIINGIKTSVIEVKKSLITPLMVNLFVFIYVEEQIVPKTVKDFYERLFDLVLKRHDNTKINLNRKINSGLSHYQLHELFRLFCFICIKNNKISFDIYDFQKILSLCVKKLKIESSVDSLIV